jgi:ubiquinone/menaquinone biosynthesis C-methylase UbiE
VQKIFQVNKQEKKIILIDILILVIRDNQVDVVVSTLTLSCCKDAHQVLREIRRILKPVNEKFDEYQTLK